MPRPRWARSCGRSPSVTSASWDAVACRFLAGLAARTPLLAGLAGRVLVDIDDTIVEVHGYAKPVGAAVRAGAQVSVTVRADPKVRAAIAAIPDGVWSAIEYPDAVFDDGTGRWISRAEVAELHVRRSDTDAGLPWPHR